MIGRAFLLEFNPTGRGIIECKRTRLDGTPHGIIEYAVDGPEPLGITGDEMDEYRLAVAIEKGNL